MFSDSFPFYIIYSCDGDSIAMRPEAKQIYRVHEF